MSGTAPESPSPSSDRALRLALAAWGRPGDPRTLASLGERWRLEVEAAPYDEAEALAALGALRDEHAASARFDPGFVDPSWYVRALQDESPAVRHAVAAHAPGPIREALEGLLPRCADDRETDRPPHPRALAWALALWSERLVGGPPIRDDDPPVIAAIASAGGASLLRLLRALGLAKLACALGDLEMGEPHGLKPSDEDRLGHFRSVFGILDEPMARVARADLAAGGRVTGKALPRLGLVTVARLLREVEPYRTRWALQNLPYSIAGQVRRLMAQDRDVTPMEGLIAWESRILEAALGRLRDEGRPGAEAADGGGT